MCKNFITVKLSFIILGESGHHLAYSIRQWGNNSVLKILELSHCSIPEDACCEIISALFSCTSLNYLMLAGSRLCENGLHLKRFLDTLTHWDTYAWVDVPFQLMSLVRLYLFSHYASNSFM